MANTISFGSFTITDANIYGGINHTIDLNAGEEFTVGNVASAEVSFVTDVNTVKLYSKDHSAGSFTWTEDGVTKGTFYVSEITKAQGMYTVTAYDKISLLSAPISALNITTPTTITALVGKITTYLGCSLVGTLVNGSLAVTSLPSDGTTIRDLLGYALSYSGCSGMLNGDGNLKLVYYPQSNITVTASNYKQLEAADYLCKKIDNVQILSMSADVVGTYGSGTNTLFIQNPLVCTITNTVAQNIYNKVKDFYYTPLVCEMFEANGIEVGTIATFGTAPTLVMSMSSGINGVIVSSVGNDDRTVSNTETLESIAARANEALADAAEALESAEEAQQLANTAYSFAESAQASANQAASSASTALSKANEAASAASSAQASANTAQTSANQAISDAATANTAANNAGQAAAIAQAAAEAAQGDIDDLETYFWHDAQGAHVLGDTYRTDVKDGLKVVQNTSGNVLADFAVGGTTIKSGNGTQIAHLGYGETQGESGTTNAPYYDLGERLSDYEIGAYSYAEGGHNAASGMYSHAEGANTIAVDWCCHAEGFQTVAAGMHSHAEGWGTQAGCEAQHAEGRWNIYDTRGYQDGGYAHIVGNGIDILNPSNAYALDWNGNGHFAGDVYVGCNADSSGGKKLLSGSTSAGSLKIGNVMIEWGTFLMSDASRVGTGTNPYTYSYDINFSESFASPPAISFTFRGNYTNVTRIVAYSSAVDKVVAYVHRTAQATTGSVCWIAIGNI